jgi:hypothetical protein
MGNSLAIAAAGRYVQELGADVTARRRLRIDGVTFQPAPAERRIGRGVHTHGRVSSIGN